MKSSRWAILGYIAVVVVVFGKALLPETGMMIFGDDIHRQYYFFREFFNNFLRQGIFPWWNPYLFGGEPFIANPVVNIWYPPNWLFILLPLRIAYSWHVAFHIFWAMLGMRKLTKNWISGFIFGLSGFFMARTWAGHVDVIAAASWMPWVLYTMKHKRIGIGASTFLLQILAGYQTMAFYTLIAAAFMVRPLWRLAAVAILGVGLAAFHVLPVQEFFRQSIRTYDFPYSWHAYGSLEMRSLVQLINPFQFGDQYTYNGPPPNFIEHSMFVGVSGLLMALFGILGSRGFVFLAIAFFGLWVSLGPHAPVDLQKILWTTIPMYQYLRIPPRHLILVVFGLSGLAGIGLSRMKHRVSQVVIGSVIVLEMIVFGRGFIEVKSLPETRHDKELVAILKQDKEPYRVLENFGVWLPPRDELDFDSVMSYGIYSATGYDPSIMRSYFEYASGGNGKNLVLSHDVQIPYVTDPVILDRLNVKYIMVPQEFDPFAANKRYRLIREKNYRLYENTTVLRRFFLKDPCGSVEITSYTPNRIELSIDVTCKTQLLSSEILYPGWQAFIDGEKSNVDESNSPFRTLIVDSGKHTIVYEFRPTIFMIGLGISLGVLVVLLLTSI